MTAQRRSRGQAGQPSTRFAPSPTGNLHLGHAWSAIQAFDRVAPAGGSFWLRIEDIDGARARPEFVRDIVADLTWLGLSWRGPVFQSERLDRYRAALDRLRTAGLLYPCFCTRADIAASATAPHGPAGPVYPGTCRGLSGTDRSRRIVSEPHAWRIDMAKAVASVPIPLRYGTEIGADRSLTWYDERHGLRTADPLTHGDVVLARKDAPASYHLAATVDDAAMGITHVVRGEDLLAATDIHRLLQALLGLPTPTYCHHTLLMDAAGRRLAKRTGAPALADLRAGNMDGRRLADELRAGRLPIGFATPNA